MRKSTLALVMAFLALNPLSMTYAHDHHHDHWDRGEGPMPPWQNHQGWRDNHHHHSHHHSRYNDRDFYYDGHHFRPGGEYPHRYYQDRYWVNDWHRRGLEAPPHGQRWANVNGNYVLIAVATGIITSLILNN